MWRVSVFTNWHVFSRHQSRLVGGSSWLYWQARQHISHLIWGMHASDMLVESSHFLREFSLLAVPVQRKHGQAKDWLYYTSPCCSAGRVTYASQDALALITVSAEVQLHTNSQWYFTGLETKTKVSLNYQCKELGSFSPAEILWFRSQACYFKPRLYCGQVTASSKVHQKA